ncbi:MAG: hypothetical protein C0190_03410 [Thermodesulfobacterium geofontis]|uniref:Uncharacterized protein n=1 Tax=Thermodesulfobacterium geofontis TaxID=1295609 RepID=A0A2N7PNS0_9BACT|nr:MAG: hypothetical protein C0190_03410 [Thermodesulfobacterium geofontis]PMP98130.1 MAG: hypothetical protein C0169_00460 [Thermodesulfobacterium geofontis]
MKVEKFKKFIFLFLLIFFFNSCETLGNLKSSSYEFKERTVEKIKVLLSNIPFIKRYITLYPAPKELYSETENFINELKIYKADEIFKDEYEKILKAWEKAKKLYQEKYYKSAEKELKKVNLMAKELLEKVKAYRENLKNSALKRYKKMEEIAGEVLRNTKSEEKKLQIKLYLWKLRNLIDLENYSEFEKELQNPPF